MAWSERVLTGRPSRPQGEPWGSASGIGRPGQPGPANEPARAATPLAAEAAGPLLAEARRAAEAQGYEAGRAAGEASLQAAVAAAQALAHKLETAVPKDVDMIARTVAELAVLIARRVVGAELRHDPSVLIAAIEAGLRQAAGASVITVELHPLVVDTVEGVWVARHGSRHRGYSWSFTGDPTLAADGCRLRTEHGLVEAGFEGQLSEVAAALDAAIPGYLGSALGATAEAAEAAERTALLTPESLVPSPVISTPSPAAPAAPASAAPVVLGDVAGLPDDLDLDALAGLGLDNLELDALASLGLEDAPGGPA